jgi:hypothetical protein
MPAKITMEPTPHPDRIVAVRGAAHLERWAAVEA